VETVQYKNLKFQVWDLGGQTSIRPYWRCYYSNTDAIIYVVDSMDRDRIGISKQELVSMLEVSIPCIEQLNNPVNYETNADNGILFIICTMSKVVKSRVCIGVAKLMSGLGGEIH